MQIDADGENGMNKYSQRSNTSFFVNKQNIQGGTTVLKNGTDRLAVADSSSLHSKLGRYLNRHARFSSTIHCAWTNLVVTNLRRDANYLHSIIRNDLS